MWSATRRVTKTATISLHGNSYEVDAALIGRQVEVVFDPFDLSTLQVRYQGRPMGIAVPHRIGTHIHPQARADLPVAPAAPTGIDYLGLVTAKHRAELAARINYTSLPSTDPPSTDPAGSDREGRADDPALEAELASFAALGDALGNALGSALGNALGSGELPGQLDLTDSTDDDHREGIR